MDLYGDVAIPHYFLIVIATLISMHKKREGWGRAQAVVRAF
jgi:hypothetical protein